MLLCFIVENCRCCGYEPFLKVALSLKRFFVRCHTQMPPIIVSSFWTMNQLREGNMRPWINWLCWATPTRIVDYARRLFRSCTFIKLKLLTCSLYHQHINRNDVNFSSCWFFHLVVNVPMGCSTKTFSSSSIDLFMFSHQISSWKK